MSCHKLEIVEVDLLFSRTGFSLSGFGCMQPRKIDRLKPVLLHAQLRLAYNSISFFVP